MSNESDINCQRKHLNDSTFLRAKELIMLMYISLGTRLPRFRSNEDQFEDLMGSKNF